MDAPVCVDGGFSGCADSATADRTLTLMNDDSDGLIQPARHSFLVEPTYGDECAGRYVYDVLTDGFVPTHAEPSLFGHTPMWVRNLWDVSDIDTPEECAEIVVDVAIRRELATGEWEDWDAYRVVGSWSAACLTVICGGGKWPDGDFNEQTGAPFTWVDIEGVRRVRVIVSAHDDACRQRTLSSGVAETWT